MVMGAPLQLRLHFREAGPVSCWFLRGHSFPVLVLLACLLSALWVAAAGAVWGWRRKWAWGELSQCHRFTTPRRHLFGRPPEVDEVQIETSVQARAGSCFRCELLPAPGAMTPLISPPRAPTLTRPVLWAPATRVARQALERARVIPQSSLASALSRRPAFHSPRPPSLPCPRAASDGAQDAPSDAPPPQEDGTARDVAQVLAQLQRLQGALGTLSAAASDATAAVEALSAALQRGGGASLPAPAPGSLPPMSPTGSYFGLLSGLPLGMPVAGATPANPPAPAPEPALGAGTGLVAEGAAEQLEGAGGAPSLGAQNELAVRLQQAFVQARVEGLGRPPEVALGDFARLCAEARAQGMSLQELQLQLILAEGALPAPFGKKAVVPGDEGPAQEQASLAVEAEDIRARTLWVRFVYTTLALVEAIKDGRGYGEVVPPYEGAPPDAMDGYVQQTVRSAIEDGQDLDYVLAQQRASAPISSPFIRLMRQNQILILIALRDGLAA